MVDRVVRSDAEWRALLTPLQYNVTRKNGTERAYSGEYRELKEPGVYRCVCCDAGLFRSEEKLDSDSGWPAFSAPAAADLIRTAEDCSWLMRRTDARCAGCDAHLGHLLPGGAAAGVPAAGVPAAAVPAYSINSAALKFIHRRPV